jgi:hypothetical protein
MSDASSTAEMKNRATRRALLKRLGRFAVVTPPAVTLLLAAGERPARAQAPSTEISSRQLKIAEGGLAPDAALAGMTGLSTTEGMVDIDAIGLCLGAIKAMSARVDAMERALTLSRS